MDLPGVAPGPSPCRGEVRPVAQAHSGPAGNRTRSRCLRSSGAAFCTSPVTSGPGRNRTLFRGFGGRVASYAQTLLLHQRRHPVSIRLTRETTELPRQWHNDGRPHSSRVRLRVGPSLEVGPSLPGESRTRLERGRNTPPASGWTGRWGSRPESNRASTLSQSALVSERVLPP